jgi:hypothetical protein
MNLRSPKYNQFQGFKGLCNLSLPVPRAFQFTSGSHIVGTRHHKMQGKEWNNKVWGKAVRKSNRGG